MLKIVPLEKKKSLYPILAYWAYISWYLKRNIPFNAVLNEYRKRADMENMPYSYIALWNDVPAGMVSLKKKDLSTRIELTPWLSALYVAPDFRKMGIGQQLITTIKNQSSLLGYKKIFLFIDNKNMNYLNNYYIKRGWFFLEDSKDSDNGDTKIFFHEI